MKGNYDDSILGLEVDVDDDHPTPRTDQSATLPPHSRKLFTGPGKFLQHEQRARDSLPRISWQLTSLDQLPKLITRQARDLDDGHVYSSESGTVSPPRACAIDACARSQDPGIPSRISVIREASGSASSSALDRSDRARVPS